MKERITWRLCAPRILICARTVAHVKSDNDMERYILWQGRHQGASKGRRPRDRYRLGDCESPRAYGALASGMSRPSHGKRGCRQADECQHDGNFQTLHSNTPSFSWVPVARRQTVTRLSPASLRTGYAHAHYKSRTKTDIAPAFTEGPSVRRTFHLIRANEYASSRGPTAKSLRP